MTAEAPARALPTGAAVLSDGGCALSGPALGWLQRLDAAIVGLAGAATDARYGAFVAVADLARMGYLASFPHLVTFPATVAPEALDEFSARRPDGALDLPATRPVQQALLPAACYPVYAAVRGRRLDAAHLVTTRACCFRNEDTVEPLRRQRSFSMREIVVIGTAGEVEQVLATGRAAIERLADGLGLPVAFEHATDPFFRPDDGAALLQRLDPVKQEAVRDDLAIASVNKHYDHFGAAFGIERQGRPAHSGCVAFGLERWVSVATQRWGTDPDRWPDPAGVSR